MNKLALALISIVMLAAAVKAGDSPTAKKPSPALLAAVSEIRTLDAADFTALKSWLKGDGRQALRDRGVTDRDIGALRLDTDRWGDAPLGK